MRFEQYLNQREVIIKNNNRPTLMKEIVHVRFINLAALWISGNQIESIEGLPNFFMPNIRILDLENNNIISVRVIRKADWPLLFTFGLCNNYFTNSKSLVQGHFPNLRRFLIHWDTFEEDKNRFTEHCFPSKLQVNILECLSIRANKFWFRRSILTVLKKKWEDAAIE